MEKVVASALVAIGLFIGTLLLLEWGRRLGARRIAVDPEGAESGVSAVDGVVFALVGLLIAFTFSGAATRFDARRDLIVQEANAIGTAWLRLDLLPPAEQPQIRALFRQYLDARIQTYRLIPDMVAVRAELARTNDLQRAIWSAARAAEGSPGGSPDAIKLLLPSLNEMIDIVTTRTMASKQHPPLVIYVMLVLLVLASALFAGYGMAEGRTRKWMHMLGFASTIAISIYVILDLEFPRVGLIQVDDFDRVLVDLRASMD